MNILIGQFFSYVITNNTGKILCVSKRDFSEALLLKKEIVK